MEVKIANNFDTEIYKWYEIEVYNVEEIAEGTSEPKKAGVFDEDKLPSIEVITEAVKNKGYDTFEIIEIVEKVRRYSVE